MTAWEVARLLEEAGEAVARVFLLDTPMPMRPVVTRQDKALIKLIELLECVSAISNNLHREDGAAVS